MVDWDMAKSFLFFSRIYMGRKGIFAKTMDRRQLYPCSIVDCVRGGVEHVFCAGCFVWRCVYLWRMCECVFVALMFCVALFLYGT